MRILALDLSTKPGYAVIDFNNGVPSLIWTDKGSPKCVLTSDTPLSEDYRFLGLARGVQIEVDNLIKKFAPSCIAIEQTNKGKNRTTQKQLEFIHCLVLQLLEEKNLNLLYIDSSAWRSTIKLKLNDDQKRNNKIIKLRKQVKDLSESDKPQEVRLKKAQKELDKLLTKESTKIKGKITWKHLAVAWVNEKFSGLNFKLKDNDKADAICLAFAANEILTKEVSQINIDKIFS